MDTNSKYLPFLKKRVKNLILFLIGIAALVAALPALAPENRESKAYALNNEGVSYFRNQDSLALIEENTVLPIANPIYSQTQSAKTMNVVVTAYSSSVWETDNDPYITASGAWVKEGIVANNYLPFGTKIKIPELFGDKIFVVEDRMRWDKANNHIDIWFANYWQALNFGAQRTYIEILEG